MNNEPVSQYKAITNTKIEPTVVSYTHPVKELTDEEKAKENLRKLAMVHTMLPKVKELIDQQIEEIEALKELNTMLKDAIEKRIGMDAERYSAHPVKLTDEEIANTWDDVRKDATLKSSMKDIQDFARAILRKAQEK